MCIVDVQPEVRTARRAHLVLTHVSDRPSPPQALRRLRTAEFKPYVIFVKPRVPESRRRRSAATSPAGGEHSRVTVSLLFRLRPQS